MYIDDRIQDDFLSFVRYSMGMDEPEFYVIEQDWPAIYELARKHALLGVCATGIERLPDWKRPPLELVLQWAMATLSIEKHNRKANRRCVELTGMLACDGFKSCVLKGQGVALLYPEPLRRQSGDIDVWVKAGRDDMVAYVRKRFPDAGARYHHVDYPVFDDIPVEIHFTPSWMSSPLANRLLQDWFRFLEDAQFRNRVKLPEDTGAIYVPEPWFNMVYMLVHIYRHFFDEGIGLRQLMDYYYVMQAFRKCELPGDRDSVLRLLTSLHLNGFTRALMYVMREVFHVSDDQLLMEPSEREGRFVLREILEAGNFGHGSVAIDRSQGKSWQYFYTKFKYKMHFLRHYPGETFWGNIFWVWQRIWRKKKGYV